MSELSGTIVLLVGLWLIGFALWVVVAPARARAFLQHFAITRRAHLTEMGLRMVAGVGFLYYAPQMRFPELVLYCAWVLLLSSSVLVLLPWGWHQRFAACVIPHVQRFMAVHAVLSFALGLLVLYAAFG